MRLQRQTRGGIPSQLLTKFFIQMEDYYLLAKAHDHKWALTKIANLRVKSSVPKLISTLQD